MSYAYTHTAATSQLLFPSPNDALFPRCGAEWQYRCNAGLATTCLLLFLFAVGQVLSLCARALGLATSGKIVLTNLKIVLRISDDHEDSSFAKVSCDHWPQQTSHDPSFPSTLIIGSSGSSLAVTPWQRKERKTSQLQLQLQQISKVELCILHRGGFAMHLSAFVSSSASVKRSGGITSALRHCLCYVIL
jgi:hypothetical protein